MKKYKLYLENSHGDANDNTGNTVNNIVITCLLYTSDAADEVY